MSDAAKWRNSARTIKRRIQGGVTVLAWYATYATSLAFIDSAALRFLERNEWAGALAVIGWLAAGAAIGQASVWAIFRGLPDPDTSS